MPNVMAALPNIDRAPSAQRCKVWLTPTTRVPCSYAANIEERKTWTQSQLCTWQKFRYGSWTPENVYIMSQPRRLSNIVQSLVGFRWYLEEILMFNTFFQIVDTCLSCEDIADKFVRWRRDGDFLTIFCVLYFKRAACSTFQTCILNSH